ncbi:unnamed protein product [Moneuplotes crassus]|uniref:Uncharacterized protein n=1 Tax=Euplotes crassus TaxID=5936 RepID=A0AAD1XXM1_EUPCR|nr:unnamed protein product [Moneuplotes crassus]
MLEITHAHSSAKRISQAVKRKYPKEGSFKKQKRNKSRMEQSFYRKRVPSFLSSHNDSSEHHPHEPTHLPDFIFKIIKLKNFCNSSSGFKSESLKNEELWSLLMSKNKNLKPKHGKKCMPTHEYLRMASSNMVDKQVIVQPKEEDKNFKKGIDNLKNHIKVFDKFLNIIDKNGRWKSSLSPRGKRKNNMSSTKLINNKKEIHLNPKRPRRKSFSTDSYMADTEKHCLTLTRKSERNRISVNESESPRRKIGQDSTRKFNRHLTMHKMASNSFRKKAETPKINIISVGSFEGDHGLDSPIGKLKETSAFVRKSKLVPLEITERVVPVSQGKNKVDSTKNLPDSPIVFKNCFKNAKKRALFMRKKEFHSKWKKEIKKFDKILDLRQSSQPALLEEKNSLSNSERVQFIQQALNKEIIGSIDHDAEIINRKVTQSHQHFWKIYKHQIPLKLYQTNYSQNLRNHHPKSSLGTYKSYEGPEPKQLKSKSKVVEFINQFYTNGSKIYPSTVTGKGKGIRSYSRIKNTRINPATPDMNRMDNFPKLSQTPIKTSPHLSPKPREICRNQGNLENSSPAGGMSALLNAFSPIKKREIDFKRRRVKPLFRRE